MIAFLLAAPAVAQSGESARPISSSTACYLHEIDSRTNQIYISSKEYASELARWKQVPRPAVGPIDLLTAYRVYRSEKSYAETLGTDKAMHCYMGCVIGVATSAKVTDYVGWLKEYQDLTDCDPATHFEDADSAATSRGARLGARDKSECSKLCVVEFDPAHAKHSP